METEIIEQEIDYTSTIELLKKTKVYYPKIGIKYYRLKDEYYENKMKINKFGYSAIGMLLDKLYKARIKQNKGKITCFMHTFLRIKKDDIWYTIFIARGQTANSRFSEREALLEIIKDVYKSQLFYHNSRLEVDTFQIDEDERLDIPNFMMPPYFKRRYPYTNKR